VASPGETAAHVFVPRREESAGRTDPTAVGGHPDEAGETGNRNLANANLS
jgi:hypothetical protein